jgi:hypothetical protein
VLHNGRIATFTGRERPLSTAVAARVPSVALHDEMIGLALARCFAANDECTMQDPLYSEIMPLDATTMLSAPRGRRFCLEFALAHHRRDTPEVASLWTLLYYATTQLERGRPYTGLLSSGPRDALLPNPSIAEVVESLENVPLTSVTDESILAALEVSVTGARYWQEPDGADMLLRSAELVSPLVRIAEHVLASPFAHWLSESMADQQWEVDFTHPGATVPPPRPSAKKALSAWHTQQLKDEQRAARELPVDPEYSASGEWWSMPAWGPTTTTRALSTLGPVGLSLVEDGLEWHQADVRRIQCDPSARVFEIVGSSSWAELCRAYPLDVTSSRRHDWYRTTGRNGRWMIPDWAAVSHDFDAVHLTAAAYLSAAGTAIAVTSQSSSVIAGFNPDETYWLVDVTSEADSREGWTRDDETQQWRKVG